MADKFGSNAIFVSETEFGYLALDMNATVNINMPLDECIGLKISPYYSLTFNVWKSAIIMM